MGEDEVMKEKTTIEEEIFENIKDETEGGEGGNG